MKEIDDIFKSHKFIMDLIANHCNEILKNKTHYEAISALCVITHELLELLISQIKTDQDEGLKMLENLFNKMIEDHKIKVVLERV